MKFDGYGKIVIEHGLQLHVAAAAVKHTSTCYYDVAYSPH